MTEHIIDAVITIKDEPICSAVKTKGYNSEKGNSDFWISEEL